MKYVTTIIIGAGQAGLAMSKHLTDRSIDHVLLERGEVANSWKKERWDSLRLLTPNWQSRLPGYSYNGPNPDGFMNMPEVIQYLDNYSTTIDAPVRDNTTVTSVERRFDRYVVNTTRGTWAASTLVLATGACNVASVPKLTDEIPTSVHQITPLEYKSPHQLEDGGVLVVGASATGAQLAREIQASGRPVTLSVGEHIRVPRTYRGRDIKWWMDAMGIMDMSHHDVEDLARARKLSSLQLIGSDDRTILDINELSKAGVAITGRLAGIRDGKAQFSGSLANMCNLADLKMNRLLDSIDQWIDQNAHLDIQAPLHRFAPTDVSTTPQLNIDLSDNRIKTIIWATGYRPDYSWLKIPVLDRKGNINHDGGVTEAPGMYVLGLPFLRKRNSTLIDGVGTDADFIAGHLLSGLDRAAA